MSVISNAFSPLRALVLSCGMAVLVNAPALGAQAAPAAGADERNIMAIVNRLFDGMRKGDSAMVRSVFDPQVRMITVAMRNGVNRTTLESGADNFAKAVGTPHADVWDERIANPRVHIDGNLASVWVDYGFFAGAKFSHCGIDHFLLTRNESGAWHILELADTRRTNGCEQWTKSK